MNNRLIKTLFTLLTAFFITSTLSTTAIAQQSGETKNLDRIVAVVNDHTILKSDVDQAVQQSIMQARQAQGRNIQFSEELWYSELNTMIQRYIMLDQARKDSITVSEEQVNRMLDQQINRVVNQLGSEQAVEQQIGKSIVQLRADLRKNYREELTVQKFQQQMMQDIQITRPEVKDFFEQIPKDSLPTIPEQVAVSQIVKIPPPLEDAQKQALQLAQQLRDSILNHGKTIEELARRHSDDDRSGPGGKLPMIALDDLVPEYSAAAAALEPGEISEVVKTSFGYHVIRLNKREGDRIDTNHILISIDQEGYNEQAAIDSLVAIRDSILNNPDITFAEMARKHSDDPQTAPRGGRILLNPQSSGERLIPINQLDPAMYRIVLLLEDEGDISEPKPFNTGSGSNSRQAYRIVRLDRRIPEHVANFEDDYQQIKNSALQYKRSRLMSQRLRELREDTYVEYKIPVPEQFAQQMQQSQ